MAAPEKSVQHQLPCSGWDGHILLHSRAPASVKNVLGQTPIRPRSGGSKRACTLHGCCMNDVTRENTFNAASGRPVCHMWLVPYFPTLYCTCVPLCVHVRWCEGFAGTFCSTWRYRVLKITPGMPVTIKSREEWKA